VRRLPDDDLLGERISVFARSIRALSDAMVAALGAGLETHAADLVPGRLFKSRKGGGCVVGVMLRELDPGRYETGPLRFWVVDRWRHSAASYGGPLRRNPRLRHIQWTFDAAVAELRTRRPELSKAEACAAVGRSFRRAVADELAWRSVRAAAVTQGAATGDRSVPALSSPEATA
jgi:hypothetical protein